MKKSSVWFRAVWFAAFLPVSSFAVIIFTNNTTISGSDFRYDGQDVVIGDCTLTVQGVHAFASLEILDKGRLTQSGEATGINLTITGDVRIATGGGIIVDGKASGQGSGAGIGSGSPLSGSGGSHAGIGGTSETLARAGVVYDSIAMPTAFGSSGGAGAGGNGGPGGGAIKLTIGGSLRIDGVVSANGANGLNSRSGGGSAGSIWLIAKEIAGPGSILADGGDGEPGAGGGGGGGRIALYYKQYQFTGSVSAKGGKGYQAGGAGSIHKKGESEAIGVVLYDNAGRAGNSTLAQMPSNSDLFIRNSTTAVAGSSVTVRNLGIGSNGWLNISNRAFTITVIGNATIDYGGGIQADRANTSNTQGDGRIYSIAPIFSTVGSGGGYGGFGGAISNGPYGGTAFGSTTSPSDVGGRGGSLFRLGGFGGGGIRLNVSGLLVCNGRISADGGDGQDAYSGGGAGGSLWLTVGTLAGSGLISANGGRGNGGGLYSGGGGGGGRIAMYCGANFFLGSVVARGGFGLNPGGAGTVLITQPNSISGVVLVDNGGLAGTNTLVNAAYGLVVKGGGVVNAPLQVTGNILLNSNSWIWVGPQQSTVPIRVTGSMVIDAGSGIIADGTGSRAGTGIGAGSTSLGSPQSTLLIGNGGGYGGYGGVVAGSRIPSGGAAYGSLTSPSDAGSGGGDTRNGGAGGGRISLYISDVLALSGTISANGNGGAALGAGGGSGGTVVLEVGSFSGSGSISANGGSGDGPGGGGGGGRIAVSSSSSTFAGQISAFGGGGGAPGGAGTIFMKSTRYPSINRVMVDNGGRVGTNTSLGTFQTTVPFDLEIGGGATLWPTGATLTVSNLMVHRGGALTFQPLQTNTTLSVLGSAVIETTGFVSVNGKGYSTGAGPGRGSTTNQVGSGAGYGGKGGASSRGQGGAAYGFTAQPIERGSGGGVGLSAPVSGSEGGGALRFIVKRGLILDGSISANGNSARSESGGGGAGGSLWIDADMIFGGGSIEAKGGAGELLEGGGGGGGRVAIYTPSDLFFGTASVAGGEGFQPGEPGTIFQSAAPIPLEVLDQAPVGTVERAAAIVELQMTTIVDRATLSFADFVLTDPDGTNIALSTVVATNFGPSTVRVTFPPQIKEGVYTIRFGPEVANLHGAQMPQVYLGSFRLAWPVVLGRILDVNNQPVAGMVLEPSVGPFSATTDSQGYYNLKLPPATNLTVTPSKDGLTFVPASRFYSHLDGSLINQDYTVWLAPLLAARIEPGNLGLTWSATAGSQYQVFYSTNLIDWFPYTGNSNATNLNTVMRISTPIEVSGQRFFRLQVIR